MYVYKVVVGVDLINKLLRNFYFLNTELQLIFIKNNFVLFNHKISDKFTFSHF